MYEHPLRQEAASAVPLGTSYAGFFSQMNSSLAGGDWKVVWGPCVYSRKPTLPSSATNAMYVAYSAKLSTYVVAIAATNPTSLYDWVTEGSIPRSEAGVRTVCTCQVPCSSLAGSTHCGYSPVSSRQAVIPSA